jgi:hypothetical protein
MQVRLSGKALRGPSEYRGFALVCSPLRSPRLVHSRVFQKGVESRPGQIETVLSQISNLQLRDDAERLSISFEAVQVRIGREFRLQRSFSDVTERRMSHVVGQTRCFHDIGIYAAEPQDCLFGLFSQELLGEPATDLGNLERMGEAIVEDLDLACFEDLGYGREPPKRSRVQNPIPIPRGRGTNIAWA